MLPRSNPESPAISTGLAVRLAASVLLLVAAAVFTWQTIEGLAQRRALRTELAEISHVRYGLLNANRWVEILVPVLDAKIDALDLNATNSASLRPMVVNALNHLLLSVKDQMSAKPAQGAPTGGFMAQGNSMIVNMIIGALQPHVPEYADVVLKEMGKPEAREALKNYIRAQLTDGAKTTFGAVDMREYQAILQEHGCADAAGCKRDLGYQIAAFDVVIAAQYLTVLATAAVAFVLLLTAGPLRTASAVVLLLFCLVLLVGGILTPMLEVEAKISRVSLTILGHPVSFTDQVLYFQSKSVLEVFRALIDTGRPDMWLVAILVLMFSVVFPILKLCTSALCLYHPALLRQNRVARFFALESSKWSMADVMALAIFMAFVAFNGLIANTMRGLLETGADLAIPTDSSKILPGYHLFIGFCLASLFLSKKLGRGLRERDPDAD